MPVVAHIPQRMETDQGHAHLIRLLRAAHQSLSLFIELFKELESEVSRANDTVLKLISENKTLKASNAAKDAQIADLTARAVDVATLDAADSELADTTAGSGGNDTTAAAAGNTAPAGNDTITPDRGSLVGSA